MVYTAQVTMDSTAGVPWLSLLVALPLVFALLLWLVRPLRSAGREVALMVSVAVLAGVLVMMFTGYDFSGYRRGLPAGRELPLDQGHRSELGFGCQRSGSGDDHLGHRPDTAGAAGFVERR